MEEIQLQLAEWTERNEGKESVSRERMMSPVVSFLKKNMSTRRLQHQNQRMNTRR